MTSINNKSIGVFHEHKGEPTIVEDSIYVVDRKRNHFLFDVIPMGAVRMTQSDKWRTNPNHPDPNKRQREVVRRYFKFKNDLFDQSLQMKFELGNFLDAVYFIPMPQSWSEKKRKSMVGLPCKVKPDTDNITKAIKDALKVEDGDVWWEKAEKRWGFYGSILIYQ
jgi:Holliday junction resolvase RusA-like endonuclease